MTRPNPDPRPQHERVAAELRARILDGSLAPRARLPSVTQLVAEFETANATVQRALDLLKAEGLVRSRPGAGVFVHDEPPFVVDAAAYLPVTPDGFEYRLLDVAAATPPPDVAELLQAEQAILRRRLMLHNGHPVELSASYYPHDIAAGTPLARKRRIPGGAPRLLTELGHPQDVAFVDRIAVRPPTTAEVEKLQLPHGASVIRQLRLIRDTGGSPVEVTVMLKGSHRHQLRYTIAGGS
ncbi:GntR family transcriptional regulator [Amycolatopsis sp. OK19-0408]|uniref:GntR family transcriptional regulator n=1 Tax=Amycolatopsis iheyensis TaxID=2945988 RepID=A0A9X2NL80_9PSEU|nr:GntR family transcriptional regulator [Amycolatopsis iheyensis]MCR6488357.1 GntR family transcriptional regulator [Amycolatopsis iheyensis]